MIIIILATSTRKLIELQNKAHLNSSNL